MKTILIVASLLLSVCTNAQLIRQNEVDKVTGKHIIRTETIALTKGFIYTFVSSNGDKYVEVRFQKHGQFFVSEGDTLVYTFNDGFVLNAVAVRGGQGNRPARPKSPRILSLWSLFKIENEDFNRLITGTVISVYIKPREAVTIYDADLVFGKVKRQPAELLNKRAKALVDAENSKLP